MAETHLTTEWPATRASVVTSRLGLRIQLSEPEGNGLRAEVPVPASLPVLAGHFPGLPVLPGVYLVDATQALASALRPDADLRLTAIDRVRFRAPVFPGDLLYVSVELSDTRPGELTCRASVRTDHGPVADLRLALAEGGTR